MIRAPTNFLFHQEQSARSAGVLRDIDQQSMKQVHGPFTQAAILVALAGLGREKVTYQQLNYEPTTSTI